MSSVFVLIPLALGLLVVALGAFAWAVRSAQFDDLDSPAMRILFEEDERATPPREAPSS